MNTIRKGKIARLPEDIREQLNQRLSNHESSTPLVKWLNSLPEVRAVMTEEFGGKAIYKQNLHEWRQGGYADWQRQQEAVKMLEQLAAQGKETAKAAPGPLMEKVTAWLTARYLVAAQKLRAGEDEADWNRLRELCHDMVTLRRGEQHAHRLEFEREKFGLERVLKKKGGTPLPIRIRCERGEGEGEREKVQAALGASRTGNTLQGAAMGETGL